MINKSLLTLGLVINKLSEGAQLNGSCAASCLPLYAGTALRCSWSIERSRPCSIMPVHIASSTSNY